MRSARILVVEDKAENLELMVYLLTAFGHEAIVATDGEAGVRAALDTHPDLVLMDLHMPVLDGYGAAARLKADPAVRAIPIVAVSALAMVGDREKVLAAGFDGYVAKPIDPASFLGEIAEFLPAEEAT